MSIIEIKNKKMTLPIIQGGMGVGISLSKLAGSVASFGAMGTISGVNPGYEDENFMKNPLEANIRAIHREVKKAKEISKGLGIIAVNIMYAITDYEIMVRESVKAGADAIVSGAGLALNLPEFVEESTIIAPIVSSKRALALIIKQWQKRYDRTPDFVVIEGPLAGGHLGFKEDEIQKKTLEDCVKEIVPFVDDLSKEISKKIYLFAAGGIRNKSQMDRLIDLGVDGIQVGTPFIATKECDANEAFKKQIINSSDRDIAIIKSPAGLPARAIKNDFLKEVDPNHVRARRCLNCLKTCNPITSPYCLAKELSNAAKGRKGLVFTGFNIDNIKKIRDVKSVLSDFWEGI